MPLTRGEALGYDAELMAFKFTMRNGQQFVQCEVSRAALGDLAGGWTGSVARDRSVRGASRSYRSDSVRTVDQISNEETRLVRIFAKHIPSSTRQR